MNARMMALCAVCVASLVMTVAWLSACGRSATSTAITSPSQPAVDRQATEQYFASLAPAIEMDYQIQTRLDEAFTGLANTTDPFDRGAWTRFAQALSATAGDAQRVLDEYTAVKPPKAFASAHALLVEINTTSLRFSRTVIDNVKKHKPIKDWAAHVMEQAAGQAALADRMLEGFTRAAALVGLQPPAKLVSIYSDQSSDPSASPQPSI